MWLPRDLAEHIVALPETIHGPTSKPGTVDNPPGPISSLSKEFDKFTVGASENIDRSISAYSCATTLNVDATSWYSNVTTPDTGPTPQGTAVTLLDAGNISPDAGVTSLDIGTTGTDTCEAATPPDIGSGFIE